MWLPSTCLRQLAPPGSLFEAGAKTSLGWFGSLRFFGSRAVEAGLHPGDPGDEATDFGGRSARAARGVYPGPIYHRWWIPGIGFVMLFSLILRGKNMNKTLLGMDKRGPDLCRIQVLGVLSMNLSMMFLPFHHVQIDSPIQYAICHLNGVLPPFDTAWVGHFFLGGALR